MRLFARIASCFVAATLLICTEARATDPYGVEVEPRGPGWLAEDATDVWGINETIRYRAVCNPCDEGTHNCLFDMNQAPDFLEHEATDSSASDRVYGDEQYADGDGLELYVSCAGEGFNHDVPNPPRWFVVANLPVSDFFTITGAEERADGKWYASQNASSWVTMGAIIDPGNWSLVPDPRLKGSVENGTNFVKWWVNDTEVEPQSDQITYTFPKTTVGEYEIECRVGPYGAVRSATVVIVAQQLDISAKDLSETVIAEANEENPGVFVHYNLDNDNGNTDGGGNPIADYTDVTSAVTGENDLCNFSITVLPANLATGVVALKRDNVKVAVWKSATKGSTNAVLITGTEKTWDLSVTAQRDEFNAVKSTLYAEGVQTGNATLTVEYRVGGTVILDDRVNYTFIAAACGTQPNPTLRSNVEGSFGVVHCEWSVMAPPSAVYNCIAWSVDNTTSIFDAVYMDEHNDHDHIFDDADVDKFYLDQKGWVPITAGTDEQKAAQAEAMYYPFAGGAWRYLVDEMPEGFHAARKKNCACGAGKWIMYESKLGSNERLEHVWNQLNSGYGAPTRFYKSP